MTEVVIATNATIVLSASFVKESHPDAPVTDDGDGKENQSCNEDSATVKTSNKVSQTGTQTIPSTKSYSLSRAVIASFHCE